MIALESATRQWQRVHDLVTARATSAEVTLSCTPLALAGPKDDTTQLCRMSQGDSVWVLRSRHGSLSRVNLVGSRHDRYRAVRMFSPGVWVLAGEDDSPTSPGTSNVSSKAWLEVIKVSGNWDYQRQGARRHAVPLERQGQQLARAELDLDGDGNDELVFSSPLSISRVADSGAVLEPFLRGGLPDAVADLHLTDFNRDGVLDVMAVTSMTPFAGTSHTAYFLKGQLKGSTD